MGGSDGTIRLTPWRGSESTRVIEQHSDWVLAVAFSPNGEWVASASRDRSARVFRVANGEMISAFLEHGKPVQALVFDASGEKVFSGGKDNALHVWSVKEGKKLGSAAGFGGEIHALARVEGRVYSGSADGKVRSHSAENSPGTTVVLDCGSPVLALAHDARGRRLACGTQNGEVWVIELGKQGSPVRLHAGRN